MIKTLDEMREAVVNSKKKQTVVVAAAQDEYVLGSLNEAVRQGLINAILVGNSIEIYEKMALLNILADTFTIVDVPGDTKEQSAKAVQLIIEGKADILMKGIVETGVLLKEVFKFKDDLKTSAIISHLAVFEMPSYPRLLFASDAAIVIEPTLEQKKDIIENALPVMKAFGIRIPKIASICAKEHEDPKMPATVDAAALLNMNMTGMISGCQLSGPLALDGAVSPEAAEHKGITDPVAGFADMLLFSNIEVGNTFYKTMVQLCKAKNAATVLGLKIPLVLTSRSDSEQCKFNSIAMAAYIAMKQGE